MPRIIGSNPGNLTRGVATRLGITRDQLRDALHSIKHGAKLRATDRVTIWNDGTVTDEADVWIGNIYQEI
jgi:hypothetical protein